MTDPQAIADGLSEALATHDATCAECPVDKPGLNPSARCPVCRATNAQSCGLKDSAAYTFIKSVRAILAKEEK